MPKLEQRRPHATFAEFSGSKEPFSSIISGEDASSVNTRQQHSRVLLLACFESLRKLLRSDVSFLWALMLSIFAASFSVDVGDWEILWKHGIPQRHRQTFTYVWAHSLADLLCLMCERMFSYLVIALLLFFWFFVLVAILASFSRKSQLKAFNRRWRMLQSLGTVWFPAYPSHCTSVGPYWVQSVILSHVL